jgi:hypothetical protein
VTLRVTVGVTLGVDTGDEMHEPGGRDANPDARGNTSADLRVAGEGGAPSGMAPSTTEVDDAATVPYRSFPWPLVAGVLAAVLLLALGAGIFANRYLRQPTVIVPPPTSAAVAVATATPAAPAATSASTTVMPLVADPTTTPPPRSPSTPTVAAAAPATTAAAAVTPIPTSRPTVSPALVEELDRAYEHYWQVRAEALFDLDESRLPEVMADEHLEAVAKFIAELRSENRAVQTKVTHSYMFTSISPVEARILDTYVDNSVYVDPGSGARLSEPVGNSLKELYTMSKSDGAWRVVSVIRSQ